jgi:SAM-dependent methyltransferase
MLSSAFLGELHCPYCGGGLTVDRLLRGGMEAIEHAVVRCGCYRYPVIDGILSLRQSSGVASTDDFRVLQLLAGDFDAARAAAMGPVVSSSPVTRPGIAGLLNRVLKRRSNAGGPAREPGGNAAPADDDFASVLGRWRPGLYGQYLYHRYANNSFHASVPLLLLLGDLDPKDRPHRVLELTCGIGHSAFLMGATFPQMEVVATDFDFTNLWIAKRHFAPHAQLVCLDAEVPLPFADGSFSAVFCLDGFHYVRSKVALGKETVRVGADDALFLFPHLHNALQHNIHAGIPLAPEAYRNCFGALPCRLYDEALVLRDFVNQGSLALDRTGTPETLAQAQSLGLVGTRRDGFWHRRDDLVRRLCERPTQLIPNPLYRIEPGPDGIDLRSQWPDPALETECAPVKAYLPEALRLEPALLACLDGASMPPANEPRLRELVQRFALVTLPAAAFAGRWNDARQASRAR